MPAEDKAREAILAQLHVLEQRGHLWWATVKLLRLYTRGEQRHLSAISELKPLLIEHVQELHSFVRSTVRSGFDPVHSQDLVQAVSLYTAASLLKEAQAVNVIDAKNQELTQDFDRARQIAEKSLGNHRLLHDVRGITEFFGLNRAIESASDQSHVVAARPNDWTFLPFLARMSLKDQADIHSKAFPATSDGAFWVERGGHIQEQLPSQLWPQAFVCASRLICHDVLVAGTGFDHDAQPPKVRDADLVLITRLEMTIRQHHPAFEQVTIISPQFPKALAQLVAGLEHRQVVRLAAAFAKAELRSRYALLPLPGVPVCNAYAAEQSSPSISTVNGADVNRQTRRGFGAISSGQSNRGTATTPRRWSEAQPKSSAHLKLVRS